MIQKSATGNSEVESYQVFKVERCMQLIHTSDQKSDIVNHGVLVSLWPRIDYASFEETIAMMLRIVSTAFTMVSTATNSCFPWKLCPPANRLGQGKPM